MKKILAVVLSVIMLLSFVACDSEQKNETNCSSCGDVISKSASFCEHCGVRIKDINIENTSTVEPTATPVPTKKITITLDNWDTYFEFTKKEEENINKYNELEDITTSYYFTLKDDYILASEGTHINVEFSFKQTMKICELDKINKKIVWGEPVDKAKTVVKEKEFYNSWLLTNSIISDNNLVSYENNLKYQYSDFEVLRIYGALTICE